jgi:hypothetical protein
MFLLEQSLSHVTTDKSRTASQKYVHSASSKPVLVNLSSVMLGMIAYQIARSDEQQATGLIGDSLPAASYKYVH